MNGLEVLVLHYLENKNEDYEFNSLFWKERYFTNPDKIVRKLFDQDYVKLDYDIEINLKQFVSDELKNILRAENLRVNGRKNDLIQRIINYGDIKSYQHLLKKSWIPTVKGNNLIRKTDFVSYVHNKNIEAFDVIDVYDYYLSNQQLNSKEIIIGSMRKKLAFRMATGDAYATIGLWVFYWKLSEIYRDYDDNYGQFINLINGLVVRFINRYEGRPLVDTWLVEFDRFLQEYGLNEKMMDELKMLLSMNEEYRKDIKKIISLCIEDLEKLNVTYASIFSNNEINMIITEWLNENPEEYIAIYKQVFLNNGGNFKGNLKKIKDNDILYTLFLEEPEITNLGDSVLSSEECIKCKETGVYIGPEINFVELGRCMYCGTVNTVN